jgi:RimJ/RimL family protein N-acetyltransferase
VSTIKPIRGSKITLRPLVKRDAPSIYKYACNRAISRYTFLPYPYTRRNAEEWVITSGERNASGIDVNLGIELPVSGEIIGMISLNNIDHFSRHAELGYWLGKPFWGRGYVREAISLILRHSFRELKLKRVYARVMHPNTVSARLLEKCGFKYEGTLRRNIKRHGRYLDELRYGILAEEWRRA